MKIPQTYKEYRDLVEIQNFERHNICANTFGSLKILKTKKLFLYTALLFSHDKDASDAVIEQVKQLRIEQSLMNSRCYPTGCWKEEGVMILGMAPGRKGRSVPGYDLKPSFVYTNTSFYLRKALEETFGDKIPYITNTLKHATHTNQVTTEEFETCRHILNYEINAMKPKMIVALGNQVYEYLNSWNLKTRIVKALHPAAAIYSALTVQQYSERFQDIIRLARI